MNKEDLKIRTKKFALRIIHLINALPKTKIGNTIGNQLIRSATSVAANCRAVCRSKSKADFISKLGTVIEEADESAFWMELIIEAGLMPESQVSDLYKEADEILSMVVASIKTARKHK